ncbi:DUF1569 domain-containing protein [Limnoglobus roseus]|uniref:Uncharacterized protein n=1 Tax=Limnoglobus roseus TaxID=2598579 RepID=A0A5C1ACC4_9BACT|nr:DUF1569 domain-containing protein [Limnoglobus roseus]QEL17039.1 hypothetical protein PX52LOC_04015 [Limnoglobus roseus]
MPATRCQLRFQSLADVVRDAESLLAKGYDKAGNWDLSQCCHHLAYWLTCSLDGFGKQPLPIRAFLWLARNTFGPGQLKKILAKGFPPNGPTDPNSVKPSDGDDAGAVAKLKQAAERFDAHSGSILPSRFSGR